MTLGEDLLRFNRSQLYTVFDLETEGLNYFYSRPYQIAWIEFTRDKIIKENNRFIWWKDLNMSEGAAQKTNFDYKLYKEKAEDPKKVLEEFEEKLYDKNMCMVGHNILGYDVMLLRAWRAALGMKDDYSYLSRCIDTGALAKALAKKMTPDTNRIGAWQYKMLDLREKTLKWRLDFLAEKFKIPHDPKKLHDALYDISINIEVFKHLIKILDINDELLK